MSTIDKGMVREELEDYIGRKGQGSIGEVAEAADVHRETVGRFHRGISVSNPTAKKILAALDTLRAKDIVAERPTTSKSSIAQSVAGRIAEKLIHTANILNDPHFTPDHKVEELESTISSLANRLEWIRTALTENRES